MREIASLICHLAGIGMKKGEILRLVEDKRQGLGRSIAGGRGTTLKGTAWRGAGTDRERTADSNAEWSQTIGPCVNV